jgi:Fic/DOC family
MLDLHRAMFADVFAWAGTTRLEDRGPGGNVPVPWPQVRVALRQFADDLRVWVRSAGRNASLEEVADVVARAHFRFQWVHPFHDTNGRTGRVLDHYLLWVSFGLAGPFFDTTPTLEYAPTAAIGSAYYEGLRAADGHDTEPLRAYYVGRLIDAFGPFR